MNGADPDAKNAGGESPREIAARWNSPHLVRLMEMPTSAASAQNPLQGNSVVQVQQFFTVDKVAELLSVDTAFVIGLIRDGNLKTVKMNPEKVRIPADSLSRYLSTLSE